MGAPLAGATRRARLVAVSAAAAMPPRRRRRRSAELAWIAGMLAVLGAWTALLLALMEGAAPWR